MKPREQPLHIAAPSHRIAIHTPNPRRRKQLLQSLLALLRSGSQIVKMFARTLRTSLRHSTPKPAVVALQSLPRLSDAITPTHRLVIRHRDRAVLALNLFATAPAHHHKRISTPVQQNNHLLAP